MEWICNLPLYEDLIHPDEKAATLGIQKSNLYSYIAQYCGDIIERAVALPNMVLSGYPITEESAPRIFSCYKKALSRLGCKEEYPLFIDFGYELSGKVYGSEENGHTIVINSECGEIFSDEELIAFLGGKIGQILAEHPRNQAILDNLDVITNRIPFAKEIVKNNIQGIFASWMIASKYTEDRASLFASEDVDAFISMRKKQMGWGTCKTEDILHQKQPELPQHPGLYYVLMLQELPLMGGVKRIQEIVRWIGTKSFAERYCPLFYKLCLNSKEIEVSCDSVLLERHRKAMNDDLREIAMLGEQYLFGKDGLPQNTITGESFLRRAAFSGDCRAMYLEAGCLELGIVGGHKHMAEANVLYHAAASRGSKGAKLKENWRAKREMPEEVLASGRQVLGEMSLSYWISLSQTQPNNKELISVINDFWIPIDNPIFAADCNVTDEGSTGIVITEQGIFGSIKPGEIPFYIDWEEYRTAPLTQMEVEGKKYLYSGNQPIYLCGSFIKGTMADLLIKIKSKMEKQ